MSRLYRIVSSGTKLSALAVCGFSLLVAGCKDSSYSDSTASNVQPPTEAAPAAPAADAADAAQSLAAETAPAKDPASDLADAAAATLDDPTTAVDPSKVKPPKPRPQQTPLDPATYPVKIVPTLLDLGDIPTGDTGRGSIMLHNTGDEPVLLSQCKTSCGCTTANCPRGRHLKPGEEVEVEISLKGGQVERQLSKKVTFIFDEGTLDMQVKGNAVAYVVVEPARIDPETMTDGRMIIRAKDGEPFRITKMTPSVLAADEFSADPLEEHVFYLDWERWRELGSARKLTWYTDHPKTERVLATVQAKVRPVDRQTTRPPVNPVGPVASAERYVKEGNVEALMKLIAEDDKLDIDTTERSGLTLLALAAKYGQGEVAYALVQEGADVEATDKVGRTPLMTAAQTKHPEVVQVLLDAGASLTPRDLVGSSALSWAAGFGDPQSTQLLIDAGAELEVAGQPTGFTPVIWAAGFGQPDSLRALIDAGSNLEAVDLTHGMTPLMHAARTGNVEKIQILVESGSNLEARDDAGKTPLMVACEASGANVKMIQALIDAGADINATDNRGQTVLDLARKRTDPRAEQVRNLVSSLVESE